MRTRAIVPVGPMVLLLMVPVVTRADGSFIRLGKPQALASFARTNAKEQGANPAAPRSLGLGQPRPIVRGQAPEVPPPVPPPNLPPPPLPPATSDEEIFNCGQVTKNVGSGGFFGRLWEKGNQYVEGATQALPGFMGGASLYFLKPYINNNTAIVTTTGIGTPTPSVLNTDFNWDFQLAPAAWLGWTSRSGLGVRGRFFIFDQSTNAQTASLDAAGAATTTITPPAGLSPVVGIPPRGFSSPGILLQGGAGQDALSFHSDLRIQTLDLEGTYALEAGTLSLMFSGGGRYVQMSQNYNAFLANNPVPGTSESSALISGHNFYGGGPTLALLGRWAFGNTGLSLFGNLRGSLMVGSGRQNTFFSEVIVDPINGNQNNLASRLATYNQVLPIAEIELGLEYAWKIGPSRLFIRAAGVNHTYFDAGSASERDGNLSLFGAQLSLGLNY